MKTLATILVILVLGFGIVFAVRHSHQTPSPSSSGVNVTVHYACDSGKTVTATYHNDVDTVDLALSDGRAMTALPHALSADGARYANADESFVFWNKGNGAFITEDGNNTYNNCNDTSKPLSVTTGAQPTTMYTSDQYHFSIEYPNDLKTETSFKQYYALSNAWRAEAGADTKGVPVVAIPVFRIDNNGNGNATGKPYPLYYDAEVRVGVSSDPTDIKNCLANDPGFDSEKSQSVTVNGITFKKFSFSDAAMQQYVEGNSYRTVHDNKCYVVEAVRAGSNYRDDTMTAGLSQDELDSYYNEADNIILGFKFTD